MAGVQELLEQQLCQLEQIMELEEILEESERSTTAEEESSDHFVSLSDDEFLEQYRLPKDVVTKLIEEVRPRAMANKLEAACGIPLHQKMLLTLRYLVTGEILNTVTDYYIAPSLISKAVDEVAQLISYQAPRYIHFPTPEEAHALAESFYGVAGMPGVLGCVGCTHIPLQARWGKNANIYKNCDGFHSLHVQGVCDSNLKFTHIIASWAGSVHGAIIFQNSPVYHMLKQGDYEGYYLLGDARYPCQKYLLTPQSPPRNEEEIHYNDAHTITRLCVDRTFALLKRRFACLRTSLRTKLLTAEKIVTTCAVLHNIAITRGITIMDDAEVLPEEGRETELLADEEIEDELDRKRTRTSLIQRWF